MDPPLPGKMVAMSPVLTHPQDAFSPGAPVAPAAASPSPVDRRGPFRPEALASSRTRFDAQLIGRLFRAIEASLVVMLAATICAAVHPQGVLLAPLAGVLPFAAGAPLLIVCLAGTGANFTRMRDSLGRSLGRAGGSLLLAGAGLAGLVAILPVTTAQARAAEFWFGVSTAVVVALRLVCWRCLASLRRAGKLTPNVVIVGATANAERLISHARESGDVAVLGVFDDRCPGRIPSSVGGVPVLGDTRALLTHRIIPYVDRVVLTIPASAEGRIRQLIERLHVLPNEVSLLLDIDGQIEPERTLSWLAQTPLVRLSGHQIDQSRLFAKRLQDLLFGSLILLVASPLMLLIAVAVKLDSPGPVFFRQRRHGFNNETITVWKFRSMRREAADPTASRQITANDDRVTRAGRVLRTTGLDELPQLFNVLGGEMSLVGPRPHAIGMKTGDAESARLVADYAHRHRIKPGITGWAAIHGSRGAVDTVAAIRRRVALDVEYIERQSFWLDLYILLMTLPHLLGDRQTTR